MPNSIFRSATTCSTMCLSLNGASFMYLWNSRRSVSSRYILELQCNAGRALPFNMRKPLLSPELGTNTCLFVHGQPQGGRRFSVPLPDRSLTSKENCNCRWGQILYAVDPCFARVKNLHAQWNVCVFANIAIGLNNAP
eukprot:1158561-Pelagomonas_calceolata.AAC.10